MPESLIPSIKELTSQPLSNNPITIIHPTLSLPGIIKRSYQNRIISRVKKRIANQLNVVLHVPGSKIRFHPSLRMPDYFQSPAQAKNTEMPKNVSRE